MNSSRHHLNGEEAAADAAKQFNFLENTLLKHRTLTIFGEINKEVAQRTAEKLLALSFEGDAPITIFIGSPGGHVESGDTIYDMIRFIKPVVRTVGTGWVGSIATHIYLAPRERESLRAAEYALPDSPAVRRLRRRRHRHRDSGARNHQDARNASIETIAEQTGQPLERVAQDTDRDYWMSPEESVAYGLVGQIIKSASELPG